jgi:phosphatidylglycerol---prolipoprotein diacylglyceryl transferase
VTFPVEFHFWGFSIHAHLAMEIIGYAAATRLYFALGRWFPSHKLGDERQLWIIVGCLAGAVLGAKILAIVESIHAYWPYRHDPRIWLGGKTIAGGLAGGWAGVEIVKRDQGIRQSTGDRFVFPILLGLCIGRVGCFLTGLSDHTYGIATSLPWGVDFGDGIPRHPTQLYEIVFCILLAGALILRMRRPWREGELFRLLMLGYFSWRFCVEFIKPRETYWGLSPIQITSFVVACVALRSLMRIRGGPADLPVVTAEAAHA